MNSTMQNSQLSITEIFRHGAEQYPDSEIITFEGERAKHTTYAEVAERVNRLAGALRTLGVSSGDRVGTLCWNHQEHMEAYLAIPSMGAVLHTLNLRLPPSQLAQIIIHAQDKVVIVDDFARTTVGVGDRAMSECREGDRRRVGGGLGARRHTGVRDAACG